MIFLFAFLVLVAPCSGATDPTPPNSSDSTTPSGSELLDNSTLTTQSNTSPSSPAHPTQPGQDSNLVRQPYQRHPSSRSAATQSRTNTSSSSSAHPSHPGQNDDRITPPYFRHRFTPSPLTQSRTNTSSSSSAHPAQPGQNEDRIHVFQRPSHESTTRVPWYHGNELYAAERASHGIPPNQFHLMDHLSLCVIQYVFAWGIGYASVRPNLDTTSIYVQAFLNHGALSLFLLANAVFPRTRPGLAFILDRLSFLLIVISAYLASLPMFPPYVAIIMFLVVAIIYMFSHFRC